MNLITRFLSALKQLLATAPSARCRSVSKDCVANHPGNRRRSGSRTNTEGDQRDSFRFAPGLFETRTDVIEELSYRGFDWLSHYSSVDPIHDCYGIEVCGIHDKDDATDILQILIEMFPDWRPG